MVVAVPAAMGLLIRRSWRLETARAAQGRGFRPAGKLRWSDEDSPD
jgi:hypothetical protein